MKRNKIAMLLAMALTLTQGAAVPVAAEELTVDAVQDDSDVEVTAETEDLDAEEDAEVSVENEENASDESLVVAEEDAGALEEFSDGADVGEENRQYDLVQYYENTTGMDSMIPNSTMIMHTELYDSTDEENYVMIPDYELEIQASPDGDYSSMADISIDKENSHDIIIKSKDQSGDVDFSIVVKVDGKQVYKSNTSFSVNEYVILPDGYVDKDGDAINPEVGDELNIAEMQPRLVRFVDGKETPVSGDYQIVISSGTDENGQKIYEYDTEGWEWITVPDQELPILKRTSEESVWFRLAALMKDDEGNWNWVASREYDFSSLSGDDSDVWHEDDTSEAESDYELWVDYADTIGNGAMLPNSQMTVTTDLVNKKDNYSQVTDYRLEIVEPSKFGEATIINDGKNLLINSKDMIRSGCIYVSVQIPDGNGGYKEAFKKDIFFSVNNLMLSPQTLVDKTGNKLNPKVGESINLAKLNIGLLEYRDGSLVPVGDPESLRIRVFAGEIDGEMDYDYDVKGWELQEIPGQDLPMMTRKSSDSTWFAVIAETKDEEGYWYQIARRMYFIDENNEIHSHSWELKNVIKEATCTVNGSKIEKCAFCDAEKTETILATGHHTVVKDPAVAATALTEGKTEGSHCSVCGTVLKKQDVVAKLAPTISLTASSLKMKTGQSTTAFKATGFTTGDYVTNVTSSKPGTVKVTNVKNDGTFKLTAGKKAGSATVTVSLASGKNAAFKVTVQKSAVKTTKITTTTRNLTLKKGDTYKKLASSIIVAPVTSKEKITYSSSNKKVASVTSKGVIKAQKAGTAKITVKSGSKKVVVTVKVTGVKTTKLSGVPATKKIAKGKSFKIKAVAIPKNTDEKITYKSSNKKVATVTSKGVVKGLKKGTATITVQSGSKKMTCKVTVK